MASEQFDVIVLGAGPAGEVVASRLAARGLSPALVEAELVGGECAYWACIPSKTLLRAPEVAGEGRRAAGVSEPETRFSDIAEYRDYMVRNLDDRDEVRQYEEGGTRVFKDRGTIRGPGEVEVSGNVLHSGRIVVATGSRPLIPSIPGLEETGYWTNREATTLTEVPESAIVLGGGPVGIELAQLLHGFGSRVTLVETADRLLVREEPRVSELLVAALREDGIEVHVGAEVESVGRRGGARAIRTNSEQIEAQQLIVAGGRRPNVDGIGLEHVGIEPSDRGIEVDERCRAAEGVSAVGDVTGAMPFTHAAMYQGRIVFTDICGESARADLTAVPRVVFSDPEVAAVGMTEEQARNAAIDVATQRITLKDSVSRPWTYEREPRGELSRLVDRARRVLVGAWAVAPLTSEWIHYAALAIKAQIPLAVLKDTVAQFPTYTEAYLKALEKLEL